MERPGLRKQMRFLHLTVMPGLVVHLPRPSLLHGYVTRATC
jgi:hypothetical protein